MAKGQSIIGSLDDLCAEHGCPPGVNRFTWLDYMLGKLAKLEAERDALRADAERYRWLRDAAGTVDWTVIHPSSSWSRITTNYCRMTAGGMDDAIDAAIAAKEPNRE